MSHISESSSSSIHLTDITTRPLSDNGIISPTCVVSMVIFRTIRRISGHALCIFGCEHRWFGAFATSTSVSCNLYVNSCLISTNTVHLHRNIRYRDLWCLAILLQPLKSSYPILTASMTGLIVEPHFLIASSKLVRFPHEYAWLVIDNHDMMNTVYTTTRLS